MNQQDIVARLRELAQRHDPGNPTSMTLSEAADEIERLRLHAPRIVEFKSGGDISLSPPSGGFGVKSG